MRDREFRHRARRINERTPLGLILLIVGGALLARAVGADLPPWLFSWEALLITIGLSIGIMNRFRDMGWLIVTGIGMFFLMDDLYPEAKQFIWPSVIILLGLVIVLKRPRGTRWHVGINEPEQAPVYTSSGPVDTADVLDAVAVFGAVKKNILSKNFKGGEVVTVFGGSEINLTQADFVSPIKLEIVAIFGGSKLIVPANWEVRSEATAILGGVDDKRDPALTQNSGKLLILEGTAICGGIEIVSF